jgi:hypothetical protein
MYIEQITMLIELPQNAFNVKIKIRVILEPKHKHFEDSKKILREYLKILVKVRSLRCHMSSLNLDTTLRLCQVPVPLMCCNIYLLPPCYCPVHKQILKLTYL